MWSRVESGEGQIGHMQISGPLQHQREHQLGGSSFSRDGCQSSGEWVSEALKRDMRLENPALDGRVMAM